MRSIEEGQERVRGDPDASRREQGPILSVTGHLEELRRRLGISLASFLVAVAVSVTQAERLIRWLERPAQPFLTKLAFFSPTEPIIAYTKVIALAALLLAMPVILVQLWGFVRPGLTARERGSWLGFVGWGSVLFAAGVAFAYTVLLPLSLGVLLGIGKGMLEPVISIDRYLTFATTLMFWCGIVFELPMLIFFLARIGIVTPEWLRQQRPYAILVLAIIAAVVTPTTDVVSLLLVMLPLVVLYEISIPLARIATARRAPPRGAPR